MAEINLIHAGLPWSNPQKITVKADQYISQLVINRGLLNLLSNDYYLDLKTQRINQYVVQLFGPHISNQDVHWTRSGIIDLIKQYLNGQLGNSTDKYGLLKDTAYIIPVDPADTNSTKSINRIQNIINNCPKNLNGHTVIFALTPVIEDEGVADEETGEIHYNYNHSIGEYYVENKENINKIYYIDSATNQIVNTVTNNTTTYEDSRVPISLNKCYTGESITIDLKFKSILLNNFYGGTVALIGNNFFICEQAYKDTGKSLNNRQTRILIQQVQKNIDKIPSKNISIKGNGNNNTCSVVAFNNCNCDAYIWNLNVVLDQTSQASVETTGDTPKQIELAFFFPANGEDDVLTGNSRFIVADTINNQNFNDSYLTMRSVEQTMSGAMIENIVTNPPYISAVTLNNDYLVLSTSYGSFLQTLFGKYIQNDTIQTDTLYEGATLCFWMKQSFYTKNITEVPILYSLDGEGNGFYFGLEKFASIKNNDYELTQYIETTFNSKKRTDLNGDWLFWTIEIQPSNLAKNEYRISASYIDKNNRFNPILPSRTVTDTYNNKIKLSYLNLSQPVYFFGTPNIRSEASIRNILLFNTPLTQDDSSESTAKYLKALASSGTQGIPDFYNLTEVDMSQSFKNNMKGALYVYNTYSMNILGCDLKKVEA